MGHVPDVFCLRISLGSYGEKKLTGINGEKRRPNALHPEPVISSIAEYDRTTPLFTELVLDIRVFPVLFQHTPEFTDILILAAYFFLPF